MLKHLHMGKRSRLATMLLLAAGCTVLLLARSSRAPVVPLPADWNVWGTPRQTTPPVSMNDPAAAYCTKVMGYQYEVQQDKEGNSSGVCIMPDSSACDEWDFLNGKCGQKFSYCAQNGMEIRTVSSGGTYTPEYAVCVDAKGVQTGAVSNLADLSRKAFGCGNAKVSVPVYDPFSARQPETTADGYASSLDLTGSLPASFDWRNTIYKGTTGDWLSPVKNQGSCGSCWAFSAVGASEAALNMASGNPAYDPNLSEEYLVSDCDMYGGYQNCCGGYKDQALAFIRDTGIPDEACMTYTSGSCSCYGSGTCTCAHSGSGICANKACSDRCSDYSSRMQHISTIGSVAADQTSIKNALITYGPLSVSMDMSAGTWDGDVYQCASPDGIDHSVVIAGYDDSKSSWIVRNSWGSTWNGNGYFYVGYGQCNIEQYVTYVTAAQFYSISGYVRTSGGVAIPNVLITGLPGSPLTDANGYYSTSYPGGWSGTATPQLINYIFTPPSQTYSNISTNLTQDYTGAYQSSGNSILLVDDDNNAPDVQSYYTDALTALGKSYDVWNTYDSDNEPDVATLSQYKTVIWFTGYNYDTHTGPGSAAETALGSWLGGGGCLMVSAQDYDYNRGLTSFMSNYLGAASIVSDHDETTASGAGNIFTGLGPYSFSYPFTNFSDTIAPLANAEAAFTTDVGNAGIDKITTVYRTVFLGFPFEFLPAAADRQAVMGRFLDRCYNAALTVSRTGTGSGHVTASKGSLDCGSTCTASYNYGDSVVLTAAADAGSSFTGWSGGGCSGIGTCNVTVDMAKTVQAAFTMNCYTLTTAASPGAGGSVNANPTSNCTGGKYTYGTVVQLTANPATNYTFSTWSGDLGGSINPSSVTMSADHSVTANFSANNVPAAFSKYYPSSGATGRSTTLTLTWLTSLRATGYEYCIDMVDNGTCDTSWIGTGTTRSAALSNLAGSTTYSWQVRASNAGGTTYADGGTWWTFTTLPCYSLSTTVSPSGTGSVGVDVAPNCAGGKYLTGTNVHLTATSVSGYTLGSWSGGATGNANPVTVKMNSDKSVTANFVPQCYALSTSVNPVGWGSVTVNTASNCSGGLYSNGTAVQITASAGSGYVFSNWSGGATGSANPVTVTMNGAKSVTANFGIPPAPGAFSKYYPSNGATSRSTSSTLTWLTSLNAAGYEYCLTTTPTTSGTVCDTGWVNTGTTRSGPQNGLQSLTIYYWQVRANNAGGSTYADGGTWWSFTTVTCYTLTLSGSPTGSGGITPDSAPNCAGGKYGAGMVVHLSPAPAAGYGFTNWSESVTGTTVPATVTISANKSVTANYAIQCYNLTIAASPPEKGSVNVDVGPNCGSKYSYGTLVHLTAVPNTGYRFTTWSGDAGGSANPVTLTMDGDKTITGGFTTQCYSLTLTANPPVGGSINVDTPSNCAGGKYTYGTMLNLTPAAASGYAFSTWGGDLGGSTVPGNLTFYADHSVTANFVLPPAAFAKYYPSNGATGRSTALTLTWLTSLNASSYQYCLTTTSTTSSTDCDTGWVGTGTTRSAVLSGLAASTIYYWQVEAMNGAVVTGGDSGTWWSFITGPCYTLTTGANPTSEGTVNVDLAPNCAGGKYAAGATVHLTAVPNSGYSFWDWNNSPSQTTNPLTVGMSQNKTIIAWFH